MLNSTAIRVGLLLNAFGFLVACMVLDALPLHPSAGGFFALAATGVAAMSYAAQEATEQLQDKALWLEQAGESGLAVDHVARQAAQVHQVGAALSIVSWALGLLAFVNLLAAAVL